MNSILPNLEDLFYFTGLVSRYMLSGIFFWLLVKRFWKSSTLVIDLHRNFNKAVVLAGRILLLLTLVTAVINAIEMRNSGDDIVHSFLRYPWLKIGFILIGSQLFLIKALGNSRLYRIAFATLTLIALNLNSYIIFVTSFHRDYNQGGFTLDAVLDVFYFIFGSTGIFMLVLSLLKKKSTSVEVID